MTMPLDYLLSQEIKWISKLNLLKETTIIFSYIFMDSLTILQIKKYLTMQELN